MGVVSNGMLCSGDELGLTVDADGILILPADAPIGRPLGELYGDTVLDVDVKPNRGDALSIVGLAREVAAVDRRHAPSAPRPTWSRPASRPPSGCASRSRIRTSARGSSGAGWAGLRVGPSPDRVQMRLLAAGQRPISNVVDASNYVMLELGKPIHTFDAAAVRDGRIIVRRATRRRAARDARPRRARARPGHARHRRPGRADRHRRGHGRRGSEVGEGDDGRRRRVGDLRSGQHPADGLPLRAALGGEPALREGPGVPTRADRRGPDGATDRRVGRRRRSRPAPSTRTRTNPSRRASPSARRASTGCSGRHSAPTEQRELLARVGIETAPAGPGRAIRVAAGPKPLDVDPGEDEVVVATVPTWRRDLAIEADIAEEVARVRGYDLVPGSLPHTPMPPLPPRPARGPRHGPRDARRRGPDRGRDVRAGRPADRRAVPGPRRRRARRRTGAARRRADRWSSRTRCRASTRCSARA